MRRAVCLSSLLVVACSAPQGGPAGDAGASAPDASLLDAGQPPDDAGLSPLDAGIPLGAVLVDGGATFRVWAPHATAASVAGDFGDAGLAPLGDGTFAGFVAGAQAGQSWRFVLASGGQTLTRTDPRAALVGPDPGQQEPPAVLHDASSYAWQSTTYVAPTARHAVIYELHVGTFVDPSGLGQGTFQSAATKLPDLAQLGIDFVELMPVSEFPGAYSWGYDPNYPFAPCRAYGTPEDLQAFIDQAHALGIGVILDVVYNHFGLDSTRTPSLSMWCFDGPCAGGGIYFSPEPATPFGPRPAFGVAEVHDLILDSVSSWLDGYHVDGFRFDSVIAMRNTSLDGTGQEIPEGSELLRDINLSVHARDAGVLTIAEDLQGWSEITAPVDPANLGGYDTGYGFDTQWDDGFFYEVKPLLTATSDASRDVTGLVPELTAGPPMQRVVYTEDHDKVAPQNGAGNQRIPALIGLSDGAYWAERRSGLGLAIVLTTPAVPMLFMGQEFLETLPFPFSPGQAIDWTNETTYAGFRTMVHDLIALRENQAGETRGLTGDNTAVLQAANSHGGKVSPAIAYHRWVHGGPGDDTVVAANFSNVQLALPVGLPAAGAWHVRFNGDDKTYSTAFGGTPSTDVQASGAALDGEAQSGTVNLGPYSVVILSQ
ncbi:MAG TPA: alpha-amylase family glycosyl hydrolase [Myxococcales bacterium]|nr:alpha-amylase family glycosyl hydrolase [Myxococcales bacterium]